MWLSRVILLVNMSDHIFQSIDSGTFHLKNRQRVWCKEKLHSAGNCIMRKILRFSWPQCPAFHNFGFSWLSNYCSSTDVPLHRHAQRTSVLPFWCIIHVCEYLLWLLYPKFECFECSQIIRGRNIHQKKRSTYETEIGRHVVHSRLRKGNLCLSIILLL